MMERGRTGAVVLRAAPAMTMPPNSVEVKIGEELRRARPGETIRFGRSERCTICLQPRDEGISRLAGSLQCKAGTWWLTNHSQTRPFDVVDHLGFTHPLVPGARYAIDRGTVQVVLAGLVYRYCVDVTVEGSEQEDRPNLELAATGSPTAGAHDVLITPRERLALIAIFAGYFEPFPVRTDRPSTYRSAGRRLGVPADTVRKRIEHVRDKLTRAGVPELWGPHALEHLAKWVQVTGVITAEDLTLLPPRH